MEWAVKVLERMENQNTFKEIAMDFKVLMLLLRSTEHVLSLCHVVNLVLPTCNFKACCVWKANT